MVGQAAFWVVPLPSWPYSPHPMPYISPLSALQSNCQSNPEGESWASTQTTPSSSPMTSPSEKKSSSNNTTELKSRGDGQERCTHASESVMHPARHRHHTPRRARLVPAKQHLLFQKSNASSLSQRLTLVKFVRIDCERPRPERESAG